MCVLIQLEKYKNSRENPNIKAVNNTVSFEGPLTGWICSNHKMPQCNIQTATKLLTVMKVISYLVIPSLI